MKKILSFFLMISLVVNCSVSPKAINQNNEVTIRQLLLENKIDLRDYDMPENYSLDSVACAIYTIFSTSTGVASSTNTSGHSWGVIYNMSTSRTYGNYNLASGETLTIGTWGNKGYNGIWYNLESYYRSQYVSNQTYHASTIITSSQINTFRNVIPSLNSWSKFQNCSAFALKLWNNSGASIINLAPIETPSTLVTKIQTISNYGIGTNDYFFGLAPDNNYRHY